VGSGGAWSGAVVGREEGDDFGDRAAEVFAPAPGLLVAFFGYLALFGGFGFEEGKAFLVQGKAARVEVAAAEGDNIAGQAVETAEFGVGVIGGLGEGVSGGGEAEEEPVEDMVEDLGVVGRLGVSGIGIGIFGERVDEFEDFLVEFPVAEAVLGPVVEVLFGDGFSVQVLGEDGLDFGEGIEPGEDGMVRLGVVEAAVDLVAERAWEASDFTEHSL
jgi:hypothetical protein